MNLFNNYLNMIKNQILKDNNLSKIANSNKLKGVNLENPPDKLNYDLSSNVALILKKNNIKPIDIAERIKKVLLKDIDDFSEVDIAGPGFINIRLSKMLG